MVLTKQDAKTLRQTLKDLRKKRSKSPGPRRGNLLSQEEAYELRDEMTRSFSEEDARSLRQEIDALIGIPRYSCPRKLMNQFYHYGLRFFPKSMTKNQAMSLIGRALNMSDGVSKEVFQQLRHGGIVCDGVLETGLVGDHTILSLRESRTSSGEVCYYPSRYNPAYSGGFQGG